MKRIQIRLVFIRFIYNLLNVDLVDLHTFCGRGIFLLPFAFCKLLTEASAKESAGGLKISRCTHDITRTHHGIPLVYSPCVLNDIPPLN